MQQRQRRVWCCCSRPHCIHTHAGAIYGPVEIRALRPWAKRVTRVLVLPWLPLARVYVSARVRSPVLTLAAPAAGAFAAARSRHTMSISLTGLNFVRAVLLLSCLDSVLKTRRWPLPLLKSNKASHISPPAGVVVLHQLCWRCTCAVFDFFSFDAADARVKEGPVCASDLG